MGKKPFKKWIFRRDQPVRDDDRTFFVAVISAKLQRNLVLVAFVSATELCQEINVRESRKGDQK